MAQCYLRPPVPRPNILRKEVSSKRYAKTARKFGRFLLVGGFCTALQYALLAALVEGVGLSATLASTIGYVASSGVNYFLSHAFTYQSAARHRESLPKFVLITVIGLSLNGTVTFVGTTICGVYYLIAQGAATCVTLVWNFFANLGWTFESRHESNN